MKVVSIETDDLFSVIRAYEDKDAQLVAISATEPTKVLFKLIYIFE